MILRLKLILCLYYFYHLSTLSSCCTLLYHTENSPSKQYYDCLYYIETDISELKYCRQLSKAQLFHRDFNQSCYNGGQLWSFKDLAIMNVSVFDVLKWSSSIEQADRYSKYLSNTLVDAGDSYICECRNPSSFGKFCEYEFYYDDISLIDALVRQLEPRTNLDIDKGNIYVGGQLHQNRPCYTTLECDSGLMCLDWRHICDGKQQCNGGIDEDYCEMLEMNECEEDEYRCANGMCIPEGYWIDGDSDCMDWTDELNTLVSSGNLCFGVPFIVCDEHLCPYNQWSCGDGQCINDESDRHEGVRFGYYHYCQTMRDVQYMCESVRRDSQSWWTIDQGYCLPYSISYHNLGLDTTSKDDQCIFSVKCALSDSLSKDCLCKNAITCGNLVIDSCSDTILVYPELDGILSFGYLMLYERDRDWRNKKADAFQMKGQIKCIGYHITTNGAIKTLARDGFPYYNSFISEYDFCDIKSDEGTYRNYSGLPNDINCWNNSKTYNNRSYQVSFVCKTRCISKYRIRDGIRDCYHSEEDHSLNNSCPQIQRHRFQCSSSELTCLLAGTLGSGGNECLNGRDEFDSEGEITLSTNIHCDERTDQRCIYFQNYIQMSSSNRTKDELINNNSLINVIPFRSYCNSFFDTKSGIDELPEYCDQWICSLDEYRCLSGQCIPQNWICDGEWDCNDGSDEQRIFILDHLNEHNSKLFKLSQLKDQCSKEYRRDNTPFSDICNISSEYPCFRSNVSNPLNISFNRPCINLTQIGDGKSDCLSSFDERNRLSCGNARMLGYHFQLNMTYCMYYSNLCTSVYSWISGNNIDYDSICFYQSHNCTDIKDVMCLNKTCIKNGRCNGQMECQHGEDEYRCIPLSRSQLFYRTEKEVKNRLVKLRLRKYPPSKQLIKSKSFSSSVNRNQINYLTRVYEKRNAIVKSVYEIVRDALPNGTITFEDHYLPFVCNRGLAVKYFTNDTVCFCLSSYYGPQCEYYSDRITILTHLNLTNYRSTSNGITVIKVLVTFLFENETIDYAEFHVNPRLEKDKNYVKQHIYFQYPRTERFIQMKKLNRSGTQLYKVRFEAFDLHVDERIEPIGVWEYPIYFDFLPSFRLSKILHFPSPSSSLSNSSCVNYPCGQNGICQVVNSNRSSYFCLCHHDYSGIHCESYNDECNSYCSPKSFCKANYRGITRGNGHPLCLCPISIFGDRCSIKNVRCLENPCMNGGICLSKYDRMDVNNYICVCSDAFEGDRCQYARSMLDMRIVSTSESILQIGDVVATTVLYANFENPSLQLNNHYQQIYSNLPLYLTLNLTRKSLTAFPRMGFIKVYGLNYQNEEPNYHILYYHPNGKVINITIDLTSENHCPLVETLWYLISNKYSNASTLNSTTSVFFYHQICQSKRNSNATLICFRDLNYLCICESDYYRAECFQYDRSIDQCSLCLSNGYCLKGEFEEDSNDYLCLCPRCHYGKMCEYSSELMSFSLDSLIVKDMQNNHRVSTGIYISVAILIFLFGLFNNLCSFLTFIRPKPRKFGVGNYLLIVSIVDQCSLLLLLLKVIDIILGTNGILFDYENLNHYSCKIVSCLLSVFTRLTYWLTSFVTIERLLMVLFPTSPNLKNPCLALRLIISAILMVFSMHVHEVLYYTTIIDSSHSSSKMTLCVTNYTQLIVLTYNRINVLVHYFIPFLIQMISITIMIIQIAISRARTSNLQQETFSSVFKKQLKIQKELYITPMIIILSSLPQIILSFSYACQELKQSWQRYSLLVAYFLSYLPQMLGFILYVLPSTIFSEEFRRTAVGQMVLRQRLLSKITRQKKH